MWFYRELRSNLQICLLRWWRDLNWEIRFKRWGFIFWVYQCSFSEEEGWDTFRDFHAVIIKAIHWSRMNDCKRNFVYLSDTLVDINYLNFNTLNWYFLTNASIFFITADISYLKFYLIFIHIKNIWNKNTQETTLKVQNLSCSNNWVQQCQ